MSQVHFTSAEVNGLPSWNRTFSRRAKVRAVPSALHVQDVASSGTTVSMLFCGLCWSYMTRLLNTDMKGMTVDAVTSSCREGLGGLSICGKSRVPPYF